MLTFKVFVHLLRPKTIICCSLSPKLSPFWNNNSSKCFKELKNGIEVSVGQCLFKLRVKTVKMPLWSITQERFLKNRLANLKKKIMLFLYLLDQFKIRANTTNWNVLADDVTTSIVPVELDQLTLPNNREYKKIVKMVLFALFSFFFSFFFFFFFG